MKSNHVISNLKILHVLEGVILAVPLNTGLGVGVGDGVEPVHVGDGPGTWWFFLCLLGDWSAYSELEEETAKQ